VVKYNQICGGNIQRNTTKRKLKQNMMEAELFQPRRRQVKLVDLHTGADSSKESQDDDAEETAEELEKESYFDPSTEARRLFVCCADNP
jgi:hypothetical protein